MWEIGRVKLWTSRQSHGMELNINPLPEPEPVGIIAQAREGERYPRLHLRQHSQRYIFATNNNIFQNHNTRTKQPRKMGCHETHTHTTYTRNEKERKKKMYEPVRTNAKAKREIQILYTAQHENEIRTEIPNVRLEATEQVVEEGAEQVWAMTPGGSSSSCVH